MQESVNSRQQWATAKKKLGWTKPTGPKILSENGKTTQSPREMANILNRTYIARAAELYRNVPKTTLDPLDNKKLTENKNLTFDFKTVDNNTVLQILKQIKPINVNIKQ